MTEVLYQVGFIEENHGRFNLNSKKKLTWHFRIHRPSDGTHNQQDEEHAVSLAWSKRTGKQEVYLDDQEVWFGRRQGASVFDYKWTTPDGLFNFHILATSAPKLTNGFRKYDLLINRRLFVDLPVYSPYRGPDADVSAAGTSGGTSEHPGSIFEVLYPNGYPLPPTSSSSSTTTTTTTTARPPPVHDMSMAPPTSMVPYQAGDYNNNNNNSSPTSLVSYQPGSTTNYQPSSNMVPYQGGDNKNNYCSGAVANVQSKPDYAVDLLG